MVGILVSEMVSARANPSGQVHGDGQGIFHHQEIDGKLPDEGPQPAFQRGAQGMNLFRNRRIAPCPAENPGVDMGDLAVLEVGFGREIAALGPTIQFTGEPEAAMAVGRQHLGPLGRLQAHAVRSGKTCRYETDSSWVLSVVFACHLKLRETCCSIVEPVPGSGRTTIVNIR